MEMWSLSDPAPPWTVHFWQQATTCHPLLVCAPFEQKQRYNDWTCRELHGHHSQSVIWINHCTYFFPWWTCISPQAGRTQHDSYEVMLLYWFLPAFWSRANSKARTAFKLLCMDWRSRMWLQYIPNHFQKWFWYIRLRSFHKMFWCIYTRKQPNHRKHILMPCFR